MAALVARRIKSFLKLLRLAVASGGYKFSFGKCLGFRYDADGKRTVYYAYRLECLTEAARPLDVFDVVSSYLAGETTYASSPEIWKALGLTRRDVGKICRAASEIDIYDSDGSFLVRHSRNLRRDLLVAVGLQDEHIACRPRPASF